ncbi:MAG: STAS domain-containing protein [Chlorobiaceae bacterium]|nr:STAS domain-containing protein [Chlorobiaceae bacterium]NTV61612.1 STAS domain-containing protein [Chlorobiaceae bacterium]
MRCSVTNRKELTILKIEEDVFDFRHGGSFRESIQNLISKENSKNLIIDFSHVKAIDSNGISSMLMTHQMANESHGLAIFVSLCQQIKDLLKLTNLDKQLYIFASINEVMTLIEPAMKSKRCGKAKAQHPTYEIIDELCEDLDIIPVTDLHDETLDEEIAVTDETDEGAAEPQASTEKEPVSKKRGRPKKSDEP